MSERSGLSRRQIAMFEDGSANPNLRSLEMLADALLMSVPDLLTAKPEVSLGIPSIARTSETCVYVIKSNGLFKIGYTSNFKKRLAALSLACPDEVSTVNIISGAGLKEERALHKRFAQKRVSGEWFRLDDDDLALISRICDGLTDLYL